MFYKILRKLFLKRSSKFIFCGFINVLLTNLILQIMLISKIETIYSTFLSQIFNFLLGYFLYSNKVFEIVNYKKLYLAKFVLLSFLLWNINWISIIYISNYNISRNIASLLIMPFLAIISYYSQKRFIFLK